MASAVITIIIPIIMIIACAMRAVSAQRSPINNTD